MNHAGEDASPRMVDVVFALADATLGADHLGDLSLAVRRLLPWFDAEADAGILPLSGLARGNDMCFVGRRSRLILRLPIHRVASADSLVGAQLDVGGAALRVGPCSVRRLFPARGVVYSHLVSVGVDDEIEFLARCTSLLDARGLKPQLIAGKAGELRAGKARVSGFSLMLHGLGVAESLAVQESGLGEHRALGCGIFIPHKSVVAVGDRP